MMDALPPLGTKIAGKTKAGRPIVINDDGSVSTERTETVQIDGRWYNVPTMYGGKAVSTDDAIQKVKSAGFKDPDTGEALTMHPSLNAALSAAQQRSADLAKDPAVQKALKEADAMISGQHAMSREAEQRQKKLPAKDVKRFDQTILKDLMGAPNGG